MRLTFFLFLLTSHLSVSAQVAQIPWDVQQDRPVPTEVHIWRGETVDLMPRLVQGTRPVAVTNAAVEFRYREAALTTNQYRSVMVSANTNSGVLLVRWLPDYDAGAAWYDYQIIVGSNAANPRAFGRITMRGTIGHPAPGAPPPPVTLYATRDDLTAATGAIATAVQTLGTNVAAQLSSITGAQATASALIESNRVAIAAIPPPSTDARRLVDTNATEWIDGSGGRWRVTFGATTNADQLLIYDSSMSSYGVRVMNRVGTSDQWTVGSHDYDSLYAGDIYAESGFIVQGWEPGLEYMWTLLATPYDVTTFPKTYAHPSNGHTGWVDRVVSYQAVTSRWDEVANKSDKELHTDSFTNLVWRTVYSNGWCWLVAYTNTP